MPCIIKSKCQYFIKHFNKCLSNTKSCYHSRNVRKERLKKKKSGLLNGCPLSGNFISDEACKNSSTMWWAFFVQAKRTFLTSEWTRTQLDSVNFNPLKRPFTRYLLRSKHPFSIAKTRLWQFFLLLSQKKLIVTIWNVVLWN